MGTLLRKRCLSYKEEKSVETKRAKPYSKKLLAWLELMAKGVYAGFTKPDQLVCGRMRLAAQASIRNDDMRRTPTGRLEWVRSTEFTGTSEFRGILTRAEHTKTLPRHWACSRLGATIEGDGWLESTVGLLRMAHGDGFESDDHLGKAALSTREGWSDSPSDGPSDTCYIRRLMIEFSETLGPKDARRFTADDVLSFRCHGSKATLTSLATHLEIDRRWIRHQGAWKGDKEDLMPDNYLRDTQRLSLKLQERCMTHLREGGGMMELLTVPVHATPNVQANGPDLDGCKGELSNMIEDSRSSTSSESDPEVPDKLLLDHVADEANFVGAKQFLVDVTSGTYHLVDFAESLLDPTKWTPLCGGGLKIKSHKDCIALDGDSLRADVLTSNGEGCAKCFPPIDLDLVAIPCQHICGVEVEGGLCTNRCTRDATICSYQGHACPYHEPEAYSLEEPHPSLGGAFKKPKLDHPSPALTSEPQSGPWSTVGTLDALEAPSVYGEDDSVFNMPTFEEPSPKGSAA